MTSLWKSRTSAADNSWRSVAYGTDPSGNGIFVAVAFSGTGNRVMTSYNGIDWTARTSASDNNWYAVTYGQGLFVAVSYTGTDRVMTSPDGINWTSRTSAAEDSTWTSITYGNDVFVAVGDTGFYRAMNSSDGINWNICESNVNETINLGHWSDIAYGIDPSGNSIFVAVAYDNTTIAISYDSLSWVPVANGLSHKRSITYGNGLFVAVSGDGGIMTCSDPSITENWTSQTSPAANAWYSITYGAGLFVAVAATGSGDRVMSSSDGVNWATETSAADNAWLGVTYGQDNLGNDIFVAVSFNGTGDRVMTSFKKVETTLGSFTLPSDKVYSDGTVNITNPTSDNIDGTFSYTSSNTNVATVSGNTITIVNAGSCTITCLQAASSTYTASSTTASLTIGQDMTYLYDFSVPSDKVYGDGSFNLSPPSSNSDGTFSYSSSDSSVATVSGATVTIVGAGTCTITASQAATTNYTSATTDAQLTIGKATTTIGELTVPNGKVYGDGSFNLTPPSTNNSETAIAYYSDNTDVASVSGTTVTILGAGYATITAQQTESANYFGDMVSAFLTVAQATPSLGAFTFSDISFNAVSSFLIVDPTSNSPGMFSYMSDNLSVLEIMGNAATIVGAGFVTITAYQSETPNYTAAQTTGSFTVDKAATTLGTLSLLSNAVYGDMGFSLTDPTTNSNGFFSYSSDNTNVATISGNFVNIVGAGTATITANQEETFNYLSASTSSVLSIGQGTPMIGDFYISNLTFGDVDSFSIMDPMTNSDGTFSYTSSTPSVATVSSNTITIVGAGACTITADLAETSNYVSGSTTASFNVYQATPNIGQLNLSFDKVYGDASFALTDPESNNTNSVFSYTSSDTSVLTVMGNVATIVGVGSTTITATQAQSVNIVNFGHGSEFSVANDSSDKLWSSVSMSSSGQYQLACDSNGRTMLSSDYGQTWNNIMSILAGGKFCCMSSTGQYQSVYRAGSIHYSSDYGQNWLVAGTDISDPTSVSSIAMSKNGQYQTMTVVGDYLYYSSDYGATWAPATNSPQIGWTFVSISENGQYQTATTTNDVIYNSSDCGVNWTASNSLSATWTSCAMSSDGRFQSACNTSSVYYSTNFGVDWTLSNNLGTNFIQICMSSSGQYQYVCTDGNQTLYCSSDYGQNWQEVIYNPSNWMSICMSANGDYVLAAESELYLHKSFTPYTNNYTQNGVSDMLYIGKGTPVLSNFFISDKTTSDTSFTLTDPTTNGDGSFSYSSSDTDVATVSSNVVSIVGAGSCTITAFQAETDLFFSASIDSTFTITNTSKSSPTIGSLSLPSDKIFGDSPFNLTDPVSDSNGTFSYTSSDTSVATVSGNTITIVGAGSTDITATQAETSTFISGSTISTLTIAKITTVIETWTLPDKIYGDAPFNIVNPNSNNVDGIFSYTSANTSIAQVSGNTITIIGAGTVNIQLFQSSTANYTDATAVASLYIAKYTPTQGSLILPSDKVYGDASFNLTPPTTDSPMPFTYSSSDTNVATVSGQTVTIVGAGSTVITASQASSGNFFGASTDSTLTIGQILPTFGTFSVPTDKTFGDAPFTLTPPTSNNNDTLATFSYTSSDTNIATISSDVLTIVGAGSSCAITATQAETTNYFSKSVIASFSVAKASSNIGTLTLPANKKYGDSPFNIVDPSSNDELSSFSYTSSNTAVATVSGNTITIVGAGSTSITATQPSSSNYLGGSSAATLSVGKKTPTLGEFTVPSDKAYLDAPFDLTAPTSDSSANITFSSSDPNVATISGNTLTIVGAGTCGIEASQASNANYTDTFALATFTVSKAYPTIGSLTLPSDKSYGGTIFEIINPSTNSPTTFSYSLSNDTVVYLSGTQLNNVNIIAAGVVTVYASQDETANFFAGSVSADLTINKLQPTINGFSIPEKTLGVMPFVLDAPSSNSDYEGFNYSSYDTNIAEISGSTVTVNNTGTVTIEVSQPETDNCLSASATADLIIIESSASNPIGISNMDELTYYVGANAQYGEIVADIVVPYTTVLRTTNSRKILTTNQPYGIKITKDSEIDFTPVLDFTVDKDMYNSNYDSEFYPPDNPTLFPGMTPPSDTNIVQGDKNEGDRLMANYWSDWGDNIFDGWGYFFIYNVATDEYYYPLLDPVNQDDGIMATQTFTVFDTTFTIIHGWFTFGVFKFDVSCANVLKQFRFGAYGNMGYNSHGRIVHKTRSYTLNGSRTLTYVKTHNLNHDIETLFSYAVNKNPTENVGRTYIFNNVSSDDTCFMTNTITQGCLIYFAKTNDVSPTIITDIIATLA